jgi:hypothetical protein
MLFATPDFGASGIIVLFLMIAWAILLVLVGVGIFAGTRLRRRESARAKAFGLLLIVASVSAPVFCFVAPPHLVRLFYGNYPLGHYPSGKVNEGMTMEEVQAILGTPHERVERGGGETFYYWIDSFDVFYFAVDFGPDKRAIRTYGN